MKTEINGETYYSLQDYARKVDRSYNYLRHLVSGSETQAPERRAQIMPHVVRREGRVWVNEKALNAFNNANE